MSDQALPDIDFNDRDVARAARRRVLNPTGKQRRIRFLVTDEKASVNDENGNLQITLQCTPLKDPEDADSKSGPTARHMMTLPFRNGKFPNHKQPDTAGLCKGFYRALWPDEIPGYPFTDRETKVMLYKGVEIDPDQEEEFRQDSDKILLTKLKADYYKLRDGESVFLDQAFYAQVVNRDGYSNLKAFSMDLPDDCEYVPANEFSSIPEEPTEPATDVATEVETKTEPEPETKAKPTTLKGNQVKGDKKPAARA